MQLLGFTHSRERPNGGYQMVYLITRLITSERFCPEFQVIPAIRLICEICGFKLFQRHIRLPPHERVIYFLADREAGLSIDSRALSGYDRQAPLHVAVCEHLAKAITIEQV